MKYLCRMCARANFANFAAGGETRQAFVDHMLRAHGVSITVEDILQLEERRANPDDTHSQVMREVWKRRKERAAQSVAGR